MNSEQITDAPAQAVDDEAGDDFAAHTGSGPAADGSGAVDDFTVTVGPDPAQPGSTVAQDAAGSPVDPGETA